MPLYEYECGACGVRFEIIRKFSDEPVTVCTSCGQGPVHKLLSAPAIQFKGSGFYINDYARKGRGGTTEASGPASSGSSGSGSASGPSDAGSSSDKSGSSDSGGSTEKSGSSESKTGSSSSDSKPSTSDRKPAGQKSD